MKWKFTCPICGKEIETDSEESYIKDNYIGATTDCPECDGLLKIEEDLTCIDMGKYLSKIYKDEWGLDVSPETAANSYIEF